MTPLRLIVQEVECHWENTHTHRSRRFWMSKSYSGYMSCQHNGYQKYNIQSTGVCLSPMT